VHVPEVARTDSDHADLWSRKWAAGGEQIQPKKGNGGRRCRSQARLSASLGAGKGTEVMQGGDITAEQMGQRRKRRSGTIVDLQSSGNTLAGECGRKVNLCPSKGTGMSIEKQSGIQRARKKQTVQSQGAQTALGLH